MGDTEESRKHDAETEVEKEEKREKKDKEKHADEDEKGENGAEKARDKKKKDKGDKEKKKNPEDKKDPTKLRAKLEKIDSKMQALVIKKAEILKQINEAEMEAANISAPPAVA